MSHEVEQMFYAGELPWHGLGNKIEDADLYDIHGGIRKAGLNWTVNLKPLIIQEERFTEDDMPVRYVTTRKVETRYATVRSDNNLILGTVGPRYTPLQNEVAFDWFAPFLESKAAALHTAGSLDEGRKVWVLAKLALDNAPIVPNDDIAKFILLSNSHDGTLAVRVGFTPIRVVCANTLRMAHCDESKSSKLIRIRHHKDVKKTLEEVRKVMDLANQEFEATAEQYRFLASRPINALDLQKYVKIVLKVKEEKDKPLPTRTLNTIAEIVKNFEAGIGSNIPGVRGTYWGAYNAFTEYLNYKRGHQADTRMDSLWFGQSAADNDLALATAMEMANAV